MKPAEQEELLAYHIKELPSERMQAVRAALLQDAALLEESNSIAAAIAAVKDVSMHVNEAVLARNWNALRPRLKPYPVAAVPVARGWRWQMPVLAGVALAMVGGGVFFAVTRGAVAPAAGDLPQDARLGMQPAAPAAAAAAAASLSPRTPRVNGPQLHLDAGVLHLGSGVYRARGQHLPGPIHLLGLAAGAAARGEETPHTLSPNAQPSTGGNLLSQAPAADAFHESLPLPALASSAGSADGSVTGPRGRTAAGKRVRRPRTTDVMVGVGGTFLLPHTSYTAGTERTTTTATPAVAELASVHQQFRPALGYRITASYTQPTLTYNYLNQGGQINSRIFELAGTYVIQGPHRKRLSTSADAGAALLAFVPTQASEASYGYGPAAVLGVNVDYALTRHVSARLAYRAQLYRLPNFRNGNGAIPVQTPLTLSNDPVLGVVYRFGKD